MNQYYNQNLREVELFTQHTKLLVACLCHDSGKVALLPGYKVFMYVIHCHAIVVYLYTKM
jgi:hypothetical protein